MKTDGDRCHLSTLRSAPRPLVYGSVRAVEGLVDALAYMIPGCAPHDARQVVGN